MWRIAPNVLCVCGGGGGYHTTSDLKWRMEQLWCVSIHNLHQKRVVNTHPGISLPPVPTLHPINVTTVLKTPKFHTAILFFLLHTGMNLPSFFMEAWCGPSTYHTGQGSASPWQWALLYWLLLVLVASSRLEGCLQFSLLSLLCGVPTSIFLFELYFMFLNSELPKWE